MSRITASPPAAGVIDGRDKYTLVKPRGILDQELGPAKLPATYYDFAYNQRDDSRLITRQSPSWPKGQIMFVRNNPHPGRVHHIKGLLDLPICAVNDRRTEGHRVLMSPPRGLDRSSLQTTLYGRTGCTRYGANLQKKEPAVGIVPVTYAWKDELEKLTQDIVDKAVISEEDPVKGKEGYVKQMYGHLDDGHILELLCRILQTDSIPMVQAWLRRASDSEKDIVMNMLHMAALGELSYEFSGSGEQKPPPTARREPARQKRQTGLRKGMAGATAATTMRKKENPHRQGEKPTVPQLPQLKDDGPVSYMKLATGNTPLTRQATSSLPTRPGMALQKRRGQPGAPAPRPRPMTQQTPPARTQPGGGRLLVSSSGAAALQERKPATRHIRRKTSDEQRGIAYPRLWSTQ